LKHPFAGVQWVLGMIDVKVTPHGHRRWRAMSGFHVDAQSSPPKWGHEPMARMPAEVEASEYERRLARRRF